MQEAVLFSLPVFGAVVLCRAFSGDCREAFVVAREQKKRKKIDEGGLEGGLGASVGWIRCGVC